ncbi:DUF2860 family protein [Ferrimonas aestuarii]|uniref:DUF2860 domain-containing protein n=1 Tax=Ferrimonas aestuarii TaxID=2569539 RepID=A0A4U1BGG2_9GAMM|nr:DUF2860 family protein [Ferrimonas aestuarii]TKB50062.1 DUF2860 domain-containing protein [Ferrimonas aestuarii]
MRLSVTPLFLPLFFSFTSAAKLAPTAGFNGEVNLLTGYYRDTNNLSTNASAYQDNITSKAKTNNELHDSMDGKGVFGLLGEVTYTFGEELNYQLFLGTSREEIATGSLAFELGYKYELGDGTTVAISALPTLVSAEVWQDPYAVAEERQETDLSGTAGRIKIDHIMGTGFGLDFGFGSSQVDEDRAGFDAAYGSEDVASFDGDLLTDEELARLQRDRDYFSVKAQYLFYLPNKRGALLPSLTVVSSDADGEAQSYNSYKAELTYVKVHNQHSFALTLDGRYREYSEVNPLYGTLREDRQYGAFFVYEYANVFGTQNWSLVTLTGANVIDSNIDYYDADFMFVSIGANYKF